MADGFRLQINPVTEGIVEFGCARYNEAGIDWLFRVVKECSRTVFLSAVAVQRHWDSVVRHLEAIRFIWN